MACRTRPGRRAPKSGTTSKAQRAYPRKPRAPGASCQRSNRPFQARSSRLPMLEEFPDCHVRANRESRDDRCNTSKRSRIWFGTDSRRRTRPCGALPPPRGSELCNHSALSWEPKSQVSRQASYSPPTRLHSRAYGWRTSSIIMCVSSHGHSREIFFFFFQNVARKERLRFPEKPTSGHADHTQSPSARPVFLPLSAFGISWLDCEDVTRAEPCVKFSRSFWPKSRTRRTCALALPITGFQGCP